MRGDHICTAGKHCRYILRWIWLIIRLITGLCAVGQEINMSEIRCNKCGRMIVFGDMHDKEDYVLIQKEWGYFSRKDGRKYTLRMCEDCYDRLVNECVIPPKIDNVTEYA